MIVISDTSPINYLVLVEAIHLLPDMFGEIVIPLAVHHELSHQDAPKKVRYWISTHPPWLSVQTIDPAIHDPALFRLHPGEKEVILLAKQLNATLVLLDDRLAREMAQARGLQLTGLLGILAEAASRHLIDIQDIVERLQQTNFRASASLFRSLLTRQLSETQG